MSIASLFRAPAPAMAGGRHAAPDTGERPAVAFNPAPGRHAAPADDEPVLDLDLALSFVVGADFGEDDDLLASLGFGYEG